MAWKAHLDYLESLNSCGGVWYDRCETNDLPRFRSVAVHVKPFTVHEVGFGQRALYLQEVEAAAQGILEAKGYSIVRGRNITEEEFLKRAETCSASNPYLSGGRPLLAVRHNQPLFLDLGKQGDGWPGCDAALLIEYFSKQSGTSQAFTVRIQLFDIERQQIVLWTTEAGISAFFGTQYGQATRYSDGLTRTPYWFTGDEIGILKQALDKALKYLPSWSGGEWVPPAFTSPEERSNCHSFHEMLLWRNGGSGGLDHPPALSAGEKPRREPVPASSAGRSH